VESVQSVAFFDARRRRTRRRQDRLLERRHKLARFRDPARSLDTFDCDFNKKMNRALVYELATARFIAQREALDRAAVDYR
jgi:hypothetical protein